MKISGIPSFQRAWQIPGKEVVEIRSNAEHIVRKNFRSIEKNETHPPEIGMLRKWYMTWVSNNGLKIPINTAKTETTRTFLIMNQKGMSPREKITAGKRKKGISPAISYLGNETTVTIIAKVAITLVRASRR